MYRQSYHRHKKNCAKICKYVQVEEPEPSQESSSIKEELQTIKEFIQQLELRVQRLESPPAPPPQSTHPIITPRKRHKIPKQWRLNISTNQDQLCGICKNSLPLHYHLDHIVALQFGGTDHQDNLMALCYDCHVQKSKRELACRQEIRHAIQNILNMQST